MKRSEWKVRAALCVVAAIAAPLGVAQTPPAAELEPTTKKEEVFQLEKFVATGSRIRDIDMAEALPVVRFRRDEIVLGGYSSTADVIRNLPFNTGASIDPQRTATFATGARTLNLRGLGSRNTLLLINGRRVAPYGLPGGNGFDSVADLNSLIPDAAIEEIAVLKDGASAIYGSDAVAGVVNVITRKDFIGLSASTQFGTTTDTDSLEKKFDVVWGATSGKTSIIAAANWAERNSMKLKDKSYSRTSDLRSFGGVDGKSSSPFPGRVTVPGFGTVTYAAPTATPTTAGAIPYTTFNNGYDPNPVTDLLPEYERYGMYFHARHDINDRLYAFGEFTFVKYHSRIVVAATPIFGQNEQGTSTAGQMLFPATNPFNPFGVDISGANLAFRLVELGGRTTDVDVFAPRLVAGLGGEVAEWKWEASAMQTSSDVANINTNQALDRQVQAALSGVTGPRTGRTLYLNPFGPNDPELVDYLRASFNRNSKATTRLYDAHLESPGIAVPGGNLKSALGVEMRTEDMYSIRSMDEQQGQIIGGSEGFSSFGNRKVNSAFVEVATPIGTRRVTTQLAVRFEDYSDFGQTTKPKAALGYRVTDWLLLRGSFSQAFKAPDLSQLYSGGSVAFTAANQVDTRRPADAPRQLKIVTIGNPVLKPEETDVYYAGFVFSPKKTGFASFLNNLTLTFDAFRFKGTDVITTFGGTVILRNELVSPTFGSRVIRGTPTASDIAAGLPGPLLFVNDSFQNVGTQEYTGYDLGVEYDWKSENIGRFLFNSTWTYTDSIKFDDLEFIDSFTYSRFRGNASVRWFSGNFEVAWYTYYAAGYDDSNIAATALGGNNLLNRIQDTVVHNPYVRWRGFKPFTFKVGARNVFDTPPPRSYRESTGYDNLVGSGEGRFVYVEIGVDF